MWIKSLPACSNINQGMHDFTGVIFHTSEQRKEVSDPRQKRDCMDTDFISFLHTRSPFSKADPSTS